MFSGVNMIITDKGYKIFKEDLTKKLGYLIMARKENKDGTRDYDYLVSALNNDDFSNILFHYFLIFYFHSIPINPREKLNEVSLMEKINFHKNDQDFCISCSKTIEQMQTKEFNKYLLKIKL
jgi:hypothetical protein